MNSEWKKILFTLSTVVGITIIYKWYRSRSRTEWIEVGVLDSIKLYPIKSAAPFSVSSARCGKRGLLWQSEIINIADRMFVVYDVDTKSVITSRTHQELLKVLTAPGDQRGILLLKHHTMESGFYLRLPSPNGKTVSIGMKFPTTETEELSALDCGDEVATWISTAIQCPSARLGYWPDSVHRDITIARAREFPVFKFLHNKYTGAFSNLSSYLLLNKNSVEDLQKRLGDRGTVYEDNFRANITVRGAEPYAEDHWARLRIGSTARLRIIKQCVRCVLVTLNPITLEKDPHLEPLKTLKTYRQLADPTAREIEGDSPVMGCYVGMEATGEINIGDIIAVTYGQI